MERPNASLARLFGRGSSSREPDLEAGEGPGIELPEIDTTGMTSADAWAAQAQLWLDMAPPPVVANTPAAPVDEAEQARPAEAEAAAAAGLRAAAAPRAGGVDDLERALAATLALRTEMGNEPVPVDGEDAASLRSGGSDMLERVLADTLGLRADMEDAPPPALREAQNVALSLAPKQLTPEQFSKMEPADLKMFPEAKYVQMYVVKEKDKDAPPTAPVYAVPLRHNDQTIFVEFKPDVLTMTKGRVLAEGEGEGISEALEFDFVKAQWTTPEQRNASFARVRADATSRIENTLQNDEIQHAEASDSVHAQIDQIKLTIETCIAQFYRGEISYKDLSDQVDKKCEEIAKLASDKKTRGSARRRQYLTWGIGLLGTAVGITLSGLLAASRMQAQQQSGG